ncbi:hypothetical protein [Taklimakanibacter deserti]|uniref:hypothetical protein n=1 Tax=Taklimakanibacter deserti TaxID=2267839 RepID=UPI000E64EED0
MQLRSAIFVACLAAAGMQPGTVNACGYDNPQSIALGSLNWVYPDALYVRTAVSQAEVAGLLPAADPLRSGLFAFHRATAAMKSFGANLADPRLAQSGRVVSVVLIPQVLWTRFKVGPEGITMQSHVAGPEADDLVIVTEEKVIRAFLDGKVDGATAEEKGLVRFYGDAADVANVRAVLTKVTPIN